MLKFIAIFAAVIAIAVVALVAYASTRPDSFSVSRSLTINATTDNLFAMINDLHQFNDWNPYERKEPGTGTYSGADFGIGARYDWNGAKIGSGSMTISAIVLNERVTMDLAFLKPFKADNVADFTLVPNADGTEVTWSMRGPAPLISKIMDVIIGVDKMIGQDFEQGLVNLKTLAEVR
jgi:Polyketide cyclase / dehydrase and lipid transport